MSDPRRLLHGAGGPLAMELLAAGRDELPSEAALQRALEQVTLAAGATAALSHPMLEAGEAALQSAGAATGGAKAAGSVAALSKWVGVAAVGIGVSSAAPSALRWLEPKPVAPTAVGPHAPPKLTSIPSGQTPIRPTESSAAPSAASQAQTQLPSGLPPLRAAAKAPHHSSLTELRLVDSAREALQSGDAARTLDLLRRYEATIAERQFELEVGVLRMEALARLGRMEAAREQARQLLARSPSDRQAARARAIVESAGDD